MNFDQYRNHMARKSENHVLYQVEGKKKHFSETVSHITLLGNCVFASFSLLFWTRTV